MTDVTAPESGSFGDPATAAWFRDVISKQVTRELDKQRPQITYGTVTEINPDINSCLVILNGDTTPVEVKMGGLRPTHVGAYVRVAGPRGDRYIDGVMGGAAPADPDPADFDAPQNFEMGPTIYGVNSRWDPVEGAARYEVQHADDAGFTTGVRSYFTNNTEFNETILVGGQVVHGRVRAVTSYGSAGPWSAADSATAQAVATGDVVTDGNAPSISPTVTVTGGLGFLQITWSPIANNDPVEYEVHLSTTNGFTPSGATLLGETSSSFWITHYDANEVPLDYDTVYFARVIAKDPDGAAAAGGQDFGSPLRFGAIDVSRIDPEQVGDGNAPPSSPAPTITNGIGYLYATWTPLATNDYTVYDVHVSTVNGFSPSSATLVGGTPSDFFFIRKVGPGAGGGPLVYGTTYFVKLIARDVDGQAAASAQASGTPFKITDTDITPQGISTPSLAANSITAASGIIADLAVGTAKIQDAAITSAKVGAAAIQTAHIGDAQIITAKIADAAILNAKIQDAAINNAKINDVSASKLTAGTIASQNIALGTGGQFYSGSALSGGSGFVMNDQGLSFYNSGGTRLIYLNATTGAGSITGGTITGGTIRTAASGERLQLSGGDVGFLEYFSNDALETDSGAVWFNVQSQAAYVHLYPAQIDANPRALLELSSSNGDETISPRFLLTSHDFGSGATIFGDVNYVSVGHQQDVRLTSVAGLVKVNGNPLVRTSDTFGISGQYLPFGGANGHQNGGTFPSRSTEDYQFYIQCGSTVVSTDSSGFAFVSFGNTFPNGLVMVVATNGDRDAAANAFFSTSNAGNDDFLVQGVFDDGSPVASQSIRVNWIAIGW